MNNLNIEISGQGQPIILLHGWGLNAAIWQSIAAELSKHYLVLNVDLPGFGNSPIPDNEYSLDALVKVIADSIEQPTHILGWSMGGLIAQQLALSHPEKVTSLALIATTPSFIEEQDWFGIKPDVLAMFNSQLDTNIKRTLERFLAIQAMGSESAKGDIQAIKQALSQQPLPHEKALHAGLEILRTADLRQQIQNIEKPTLRLYGRLDSLVPYKSIEAIEQLQPKATTKVIDKASHAPFISHKEIFLQHLLSFLAETQK